MNLPTIEPDRRWSNQPLTRERDEQRIRNLWRTWLAIVVAFLPVGYFLVVQAQCAKLSYRAGQLRSQLERLDREERRLSTDLASLRSFERVERWADRNGMTRPESTSVFILTDRTTAADGSLLASTAQRGTH